MELAPDGSEIRVLVKSDKGSMVHCSLPPQGVSQAIKHRTVDELWYFIQGQGEFWRKKGAIEQIDTVGPGVSIDIPVGTEFQFRNLGKDPLQAIITTMPPWSGPNDPVIVKYKWKKPENRD